jgi:hypothetical protein
MPIGQQLGQISVGRAPRVGKSNKQRGKGLLFDVAKGVIPELAKPVAGALARRLARKIEGKSNKGGRMVTGGRVNSVAGTMQKGNGFRLAGQGYKLAGEGKKKKGVVHLSL